MRAKSQTNVGKLAVPPIQGVIHYRHRKKIFSPRTDRCCFPWMGMSCRSSGQACIRRDSRRCSLPSKKHSRLESGWQKLSSWSHKPGWKSSLFRATDERSVSNKRAWRDLSMTKQNKWQSSILGAHFIDSGGTTGYQAGWWALMTRDVMCTVVVRDVLAFFSLRRGMLGDAQINKDELSLNHSRQVRILKGNSQKWWAFKVLNMLSTLSQIPRDTTGYPAKTWYHVDFFTLYVSPHVSPWERPQTGLHSAWPGAACKRLSMPHARLNWMNRQRLMQVVWWVSCSFLLSPEL